MPALPQPFNRSRGRVSGLFATLLASLTGCGLCEVPESAELSATAPVALSADLTLDVALGAGAVGLSNSVWALHQSADDALLFRVRFGTDGQITEIFDNFVFAQPWLGPVIVPDGEPHPTALPGGQYVSGGYVAEDGAEVGVLGVLHGIYLGQHLGSAHLEFFGTRDGDLIEGTARRTVVIMRDTPFPAPGDAEFSAYAIREE